MPFCKKVIQLKFGNLFSGAILKSTHTHTHTHIQKIETEKKREKESKIQERYNKGPRNNNLKVIKFGEI